LDVTTAVIDFFYTGMQKSVRGAKTVLAAFYDQPAKFNYYFGCSDGGRDGLKELRGSPPNSMER
jgi:feruloyl esterase